MQQVWQVQVIPSDNFASPESSGPAARYSEDGPGTAAE